MRGKEKEGDGAMGKGTGGGENGSAGMEAGNR